MLGCRKSRVAFYNCKNLMIWRKISLCLLYLNYSTYHLNYRKATDIFTLIDFLLTSPLPFLSIYLLLKENLTFYNLASHRSVYYFYNP